MEPRATVLTIGQSLKLLYIHEWVVRMVGKQTGMSNNHRHGIGVHLQQELDSDTAHGVQAVFMNHKYWPKHISIVRACGPHMDEASWL
jgi:hypothetical protein